MIQAASLVASSGVLDHYDRDECETVAAHSCQGILNDPAGS